jgi:magnesium transporter
VVFEIEFIEIHDGWMAFVVDSKIMKQLVIEHSGSSFRWIDVMDPKPGELSELAQELSLHSTQIKDCLEPFHLPKYEAPLESGRGYSFLMIRVVEEMAPKDACTILELTRKVAIFFGENFILTVHRSELEFVEKLKVKWRDRLSRYSGSPRDHLLYDLLSESFETFDREFERSESEKEDLELTILDLRPGKYEIRNLYQLKRRAAVCRRLLRLTSEAVGRMTRDATEGARIYAFGLRDDLENTLQYSEDLAEGLNQLLSAHHSLEGQRANEVMKVLAIFSAFFFPLTLIAGIYGMNFKHMPELEWEWAYPGSLGLMTLTSVLIWFWFRRKRWL